jgi:hypothetical protein
MHKAGVSRWAVSVGVALLVLGAVLLSPLADFLPIELWVAPGKGTGSTGHTFFRVVPEQTDHVSLVVVAGAVSIAVGLGCLVIERLSRNRSES